MARHEKRARRARIKNKKKYGKHTAQEGKERLGERNLDDSVQDSKSRKIRQFYAKIKRKTRKPKPATSGIKQIEGQR